MHNIDEKVKKKKKKRGGGGGGGVEKGDRDTGLEVQLHNGTGWTLLGNPMACCCVLNHFSPSV